MNAVNVECIPLFGGVFYSVHDALGLNQDNWLCLKWAIPGPDSPCCLSDDTGQARAGAAAYDLEFVHNGKISCP